MIQHYVPRFILKNFKCKGKKKQIFVFDKHKGRIFKTNIKNVAAEKGFYDFDLTGNSYTIEPGLSDLESSCATIIKKIIEQESLSNITDKERISLSTLIAVQYLRVKEARERIGQMSKDLEGKLEAMGADLSNIKNFEVMKDDEPKLISIRLLINATNDFVPLIYDKAWLLFKSSKTESFYISDHPITLQNMKDYGPYGNLGFGVKGIEIYFPISKSLSLSCCCRTYESEWRNTLFKYRTLQKNDADSLLRGKFDPTLLEELIRGLDTGSVVSCLPGSVMNLNSLQVVFSTRYVYSSTNEFSLVRKMISDDQSLKKGMRIEIS